MTGIRKRSNSPRVDQEHINESDIYNSTYPHPASNSKYPSENHEQRSRRTENYFGHNRMTDKARAEINRRKKK